MRALVCHPGPAFSVADVHNGIVAGLNECGISAQSYNLDDRLNFYCGAHMERDGEYLRAFDYESACRLAANGLLADLYKWGPVDVVVITSGFFVPPDLYKAMRAHHHVVLWCTESPYEDDLQILKASAAHTVIVNDPTNLDQFREVNPRTFYIPHGYNPRVHNTTGPSHSANVDFTFVGTGYKSRIEFLEKVDFDGLKVSLHGNWRELDEASPLRPFVDGELDQCINNEDAVAVYRSAKVSANLYRKEAIRDELSTGWAMGPREVELAACETFFARQPRPEGDEVLWMLPTFTEPGELRDIIRWYVAHDDQRIQLAKQARAAVAERTFKNNAAELLRLISS